MKDQKLNELRALFFKSIRKDISNWTYDGTKNYWSPDYNGYKFNIDLKNESLYLFSKGFTKIRRFKLLFIPLDFKIIKSVKVLKNHFKNLKINAKLEAEISLLENSVASIECNFVKEIRKDKLKKIKNS